MNLLRSGVDCDRSAARGSNWISEMSDSPYTSPHCLGYEGVAAPVLAAHWVPPLTEEKLEAPVGERDALRWVGSLCRAQRLLAPLGLLVLAECPLLALDHHSAAIAGRDGTGAMPLRLAFTHQFPP